MPGGHFLSVAQIALFLIWAVGHDPHPQGNGYDIGYDESSYRSYRITPSAGAGGIITPSTPQTVNLGNTITFTIVANTGYQIVDVGVDGVSQGAISSYTFSNVTASHTISATFTVDTYPNYLPLILKVVGDQVRASETLFLA